MLRCIGATLPGTTEQNNAKARCQHGFCIMPSIHHSDSSRSRWHEPSSVGAGKIFMWNLPDICSDTGSFLAFNGFGAICPLRP
ncbi:uncharacterized [Tachysurus ichikawai]